MGDPGGKVELFESLKETLRRELLEETNLTCEIGKQIGVYEIIDKPNEHRVIVYSWAQPVEGQLKPAADISELKFFPRAELKKIEISPVVKKVLADIGWL